MTQETPYAGVFVKKADPMVLKDLDAEGKLYDAPKFEHEISPLLALRYSADLLCKRVLVHQDDRCERGPDPQQQYHQLDSGKHRKRTFWRLAGECSGLGNQPEPLLGNSAEHLGV